MSKRFDIRAILADPAQRKELAIRMIIATQARAGIVTTREQAEMAWQNAHTVVNNGDTSCLT